MFQTFWIHGADLNKMMLFLLLSLSTIHDATAGILGGVDNPHPSSHIHRGLDEEFLRCTVYEQNALLLRRGEEKRRRNLSCISDNYGPTVFLVGSQDTFFSDQFISGVTALDIPTRLVSTSLQVDLDHPLSEMIIVSHGDGDKVGSRRAGDVVESLSAANNTNTHSLHTEYEGRFEVLVVRVSDSNGHSPTYSSKELSKHIFTDDLTMTSQYRACSKDKLQFVPVDGNDVVNGVIDITVDEDLSRAWVSEECMIAADNTIFSSSLDLGTPAYTMYICPEAVDFGSAVAMANVRGSKSWYWDKYGSMPFVQMHEIGHNLGFFHSSEGRCDNCDPTGVMGGYFVDGNDWGRMCFNAAKTYSTGWYFDHQYDVSPYLLPYKGNIVDINSASLGRINDEEDVVVRVQTRTDSSSDLYFMLHRLEGITSDMFPIFHDTHANHINIVSQSRPEGASSRMVANLASGEEYIESNWDGTSKDLHIKVCSITDHSAKVIVYLEGETETSCNEDPSISPPTRSPTSANPHDECKDSTLKMFIRGGAIKGCAWVTANNTEDRCKIPGVASHCPMTCGTCIFCRDSGKRFQIKNEAKDIKSCAWVRRASTTSRCKKEGVPSACRATCGTCQS